MLVSYMQWIDCNINTIGKTLHRVVLNPTGTVWIYFTRKVAAEWESCKNDAVKSLFSTSGCDPGAVYYTHNTRNLKLNLY